MGTIANLQAFGAEVKARRRQEAARRGLSPSETRHFVQRGDLPGHRGLPRPAADPDHGTDAPAPTAGALCVGSGDGRPVFLSHTDLLTRLQRVSQEHSSAD